MKSARIVDELATRGQDLQGPECVVADLEGNVYASDGRGGVAHALDLMCESGSILSVLVC